MPLDFGTDLKDMLKQSDKSAAINEVLKALMQKDKSLAMKTEIGDPLRLAMFNSFGSYLKEQGATETATFLTKLEDCFLTYMVSYNRKSRKEIIEVLKHLVEEEKTRMDKLTTRY